SGWYCSGGQVLAQRWRHIARSTLETETLAQPDRGRSQGAECGDIDRLAVHHARLEQLCLHGGSREAAQQPELDLRAAIEAAHVDDEGVDQIAKTARRGRTAIEARQQVLVVRHRGTSPAADSSWRCCLSCVTKAFICRPPPSRFRPGPISRLPAVLCSETPRPIRCCEARRARGSRAIISPAPILAHRMRRRFTPTRPDCRRRSSKSAATRSSSMIPCAWRSGCAPPDVRSNSKYGRGCRTPGRSGRGSFRKRERPLSASAPSCRAR